MSMGCAVRSNGIAMETVIIVLHFHRCVDGLNEGSDAMEARQRIFKPPAPVNMRLPCSEHPAVHCLSLCVALETRKEQNAPECVPEQLIGHSTYQ